MTRHEWETSALFFSPILRLTREDRQTTAGVFGAVINESYEGAMNFLPYINKNVFVALVGREEGKKKSITFRFMHPLRCASEEESRSQMDA